MANYTNSIFIEIEDNHEKSLRGSIKRTGIKPLPFSNLNQLLIMFDLACEVAEMPQSSVKMRTFGPQPLQVDLEALVSDEEVVFNPESIVIGVVVTYRQNASWQGFVNIDEAVVPFKSELEFIKIIDQYIVKDNG